MRLSDEPIDDFYPVCCDCGEKITGDGYLLGDEYYCDDCMSHYKIDGTETAEEHRYAAYENANEE